MPSINLNDWKILIADDEPDNLSLLQDVLSFYGATVIGTTSGQEAITLIDQSQAAPFKVALLDVQMPKVTGWDIVKHVRASPLAEIQHIILIAVTALAMKGDKERILEGGFDGYISKPIDAGEFIPTIYKLVQEHSGQASS